MHVFYVQKLYTMYSSVTSKNCTCLLRLERYVAVRNIFRSKICIHVCFIHKYICDVCFVKIGLRRSLNGQHTKVKVSVRDSEIPLCCTLAEFEFCRKVEYSLLYDAHHKPSWNQVIGLVLLYM